MRKFNVGLLGCGVISKHYFKFAHDIYSDYFQITACADIIPEKAEERAKEFNIPKYGLPEVLLNDDSLDLIINLTVPAAHEEMTIKCLEAGKHVYSEKPLATGREGIKHIMAAAEKAGKRVGCAPDSFMSAPMQTAKKMIEDDWIGELIGVNAICAMRGNEYWRPDADFFYKKGAGPMMDMAAYYLNTFISIIGPVESVSAMSKMTFEERTVKVAPRRGDKIKVEVPTYITSNIMFKNGVIGTFVNSFDIWKTQSPFIEIYGEKGTMILPDPNRYVGDVLLRRLNDTEWRVVPQFVEYAAYGRGIGIVDMIRNIEAGTPHKASAELAYHVTDVILSIEESAELKKELKVNSTADMPNGLFETQDSILWK